MEKIDIERNKHKDAAKLSVSKMRRLLDKIYLGGGEKKIAKQHKKGKMTARERVDFL